MLWTWILKKTPTLWGGWVVATLGRVPRMGDTVDFADYRATVIDLKGRRIGSVRFEKNPGEQAISAERQEA